MADVDYKTFALKTPLSPLTRADRQEVEAIIEHLILVLDMVDGDVDLEEDDPVGQMDEDGLNTGTVGYAGPGCPISDTDEFSYRYAKKVA